MTVSLTVSFSDSEPPQSVEVHSINEGATRCWPSPQNPIFAAVTWRLVTDDRAFVLWPLCDSEARLVR
ncbi:MAG: hypothetical protein AAB370_03065, partial [Verrucomicrobiota bacterium]